MEQAVRKGGGEPIVKEKIRGFSLLELLVVVAIILIIATIAIPRLIRSMQATREASAVAQTRTIRVLQRTGRGDPISKRDERDMRAVLSRQSVRRTRSIDRKPVKFAKSWMTTCR